MYVLVVAISGGDVVATSVVAKSAPSNYRRGDVLFAKQVIFQFHDLSKTIVRTGGNIATSSNIKR